MNREEQLFLNHLHDLAKLCYSRNIPVYTDFLNLNEQTVFLSNLSEFSHIRTAMDGGYEGAERKIVCFLPAYGNERPSREELPIRPLCIRSAAGKFTVACSHRDYLGAVLNLGIERGKIGDFLVGDGYAYVLCSRGLADFLTEHLTFVKRNPVLCALADFSELEGQLSFAEQTGSLASLRMDSLIALFTKNSRSSAVSILESERVFVNGKLCLSHSAEPKEGDIISVRGFGKFIFDGVLSSTKKGRLMIKIRIYR
ncbi:MAG: RNA-binding protein [Lachnospiraceae bacterium]|nr:RNA-binding protein [Lachnospiraceae bacterium]